MRTESLAGKTAEGVRTQRAGRQPKGLQVFGRNPCSSLFDSTMIRYTLLALR